MKNIIDPSHHFPKQTNAPCTRARKRRQNIHAGNVYMAHTARTLFNSFCKTHKQRHTFVDSAFGVTAKEERHTMQHIGNVAFSLSYENVQTLAWIIPCSQEKRQKENVTEGTEPHLAISLGIAFSFHMHVSVGWEHGMKGGGSDLKTRLHGNWNAVHKIENLLVFLMVWSSNSVSFDTSSAGGEDKKMK